MVFLPPTFHAFADSIRQRELQKAGKWRLHSRVRRYRLAASLHILYVSALSMSRSMDQGNLDITVTSIQVAAVAVADAMGDNCPVRACWLLLGGPGAALPKGQDIDFVVPQGTTSASRRLLMDHGAFTVEPRTLHTKHTASATGVDIEILSPPALFQGSFDAATPIVMVNGVRVLHPVRILDAKCRSLLSRSHDVKRASDAEDIAFLLHRCASDGIKIRAGDMVNAIPGVLEYIIDQAWVPRQAWNAAGYVDGEGWPQ
ncbi:hypothetical protein OH76DRAFT_1400017, partial [Lentinus brumalis]